METKCLNCGRILTNEMGERLHGATFTNALSYPINPTPGVTWARCTPCTDLAMRLVAETEDKGVNVVSDGFDETYGEWFTCSRCSFSLIASGQSFCGGCGNPLIFPTIKGS